MLGKATAASTPRAASSDALGLDMVEEVPRHMFGWRRATRIVFAIEPHGSCSQVMGPADGPMPLQTGKLPLTGAAIRAAPVALVEVRVPSSVDSEAPKYCTPVLTPFTVSCTPA